MNGTRVGSCLTVVEHCSPAHSLQLLVFSTDCAGSLTTPVKWQMGSSRVGAAAPRMPDAMNREATSTVLSSSVFRFLQYTVNLPQTWHLKRLEGLGMTALMSNQLPTTPVVCRSSHIDDFCVEECMVVELVMLSVLLNGVQDPLARHLFKGILVQHEILVPLIQGSMCLQHVISGVRYSRCRRWPFATIASGPQFPHGP